MIWGSDWDPLLARDTDGALVQRMGEVVDGQYQKYVVSSGDYIRKHFFGVDPRLEAMVADLTRRSDPAARIAAGTIRRRSMPPTRRPSNTGDRRRSSWPRRSRATAWARPAKAATSRHQQKKLNEDELVEFRRRFDIPISDEAARRAEFYKPPDDSPEMQYLLRAAARR